MPFDAPVSVLNTALGLAGVALLFHTVLASLYYMFSKILNSTTQIAVSKELVAQLFFSVFLLLAFMSLDSIVPTLVGGLVCFDEPSADCSSLSHIRLAYFALEMLLVNFESLYIKFYTFEMLVAILSSISMTLGVFRVFLFVFSFHISPFVALVMIANVQVIIVESIGYSLGILYAKELILEMVTYAVPFVFFPLGLFFRSLPQLRTTGSTILALCFTMFFVFPLSLILTNYIVFDLYKPTSIYINFDDPDPVAQVCSEGTSGVDLDHLVDEFGSIESDIDSIPVEQDEGIFTKIINLVVAMFEGLWGLATLLWTLLTVMYKGGGLTSFLNPVAYLRAYYYYLIMELLVAAQFLVTIITTTILEFIIIVTAHRSISSAIGGETEIFGLSKII